MNRLPLRSFGILYNPKKPHTISEHGNLNRISAPPRDSRGSGENLAPLPPSIALTIILKLNNHVGVSHPWKTPLSNKIIKTINGQFPFQKFVSQCIYSSKNYVPGCSLPRHCLRQSCLHELQRGYLQNQDKNTGYGLQINNWVAQAYPSLSRVQISSFFERECTSNEICTPPHFTVSCIFEHGSDMSSS